MQNYRWLRICCLTVAGATLFGLAPDFQSTGIAAELSKKEATPLPVEKAKALLDQWRGQPELLEEAASELKVAFQTTPNDPRAYVELARLYLSGGFYDSTYSDPNSYLAAEKAVKKAIAISPKHAEAYVLLGHIYTSMNRLPAAKEALSTAGRIGTTSPWLQLNWAALYRKEGNFDKAAEKYIEVITQGTTNRKALSSAYDDLLSYYVETRNLVKAEETYQALIKLEPDTAWIRGNYASSLVYIAGDFDNGILKARDALKLMEYGNARHTLAMGLYGKWASIVVKEGNTARAKPYFTEANRIFPDLQRLRRDASEYVGTQVIVQALNSLSM